MAIFLRVLVFWGAQVGYAYDRVGRPASISGSGYAGIDLGGARLQAGGIHTDRLLFQAGTTDTFQASISSAISNNKFNNDKPMDSKHPGMSTFGGRQRKTFNALQAGFGHGWCLR